MGFFKPQLSIGYVHIGAFLKFYFRLGGMLMYSSCIAGMGLYSGVGYLIPDWRHQCYFNAISMVLFLSAHMELPRSFQNMYSRGKFAISVKSDQIFTK